MKDTPLKTFGYVRLSQRGRDNSIEEQKEAIREYVGERSRLNLATTFNDGKDTSGFNEDRPKYQTLLDNIESGNAEAVVVRDRARLARDFDLRMDVVRLMRDNETEFHVIEGGAADLADVMNVAIEAVHAATDHEKKMAEIERAREVVRDRLDDPDADHGRPPFGFQYDENGRRWIPDESEFSVARRILEMRSEGSSLGDIAEEVGETKSRVRRVLDNRGRISSVRSWGTRDDYTSR